MVGWHDCMFFNPDEQGRNTSTIHLCEYPLKHATSESNMFVYMQYTGILDVNDVEIYEGDIVKLGVRAKGPRVGEVIFAPKAAKFAVRIFRDGYNRNEPHLISILRSEIIGNIYENPDLLE